MARTSLGTLVRATPGRMRLLSLVAAAAIVVSWAVQLGAVSHRRAALGDLGRSEALVAVSQRFQTDLAGADSAIADAFLGGGLEPPALTGAYQHGLTAAADDASAGEGATNAQPFRTIGEQLPVYARADNRQGYPIGAAYLRSAAALVREQLLPAAAAVASDGAVKVRSDRRAATSLADVLLVLGWGLLAVAALAGAQGYLTRRTRRALNPGAAAATVIVIVALVIVLAGMGAERAGAVRAGEDGYAEVARLAQARVLAYEAKGDESQALIALGSGQSYEQDFDVDVAAAGALLRSAGSPTAALDDFVAVDRQIRTDDAAGQHAAAVATAVGRGSASFAAVDAQLSARQGRAQRTFLADVASSRRHLASLPVIATVAAALAVLLLVAGVQPRIGEYR
jgi:hypothetical protein